MCVRIYVFRRINALAILRRQLTITDRFAEYTFQGFQEHVENKYLAAVLFQLRFFSYSLS